MAKTTVTITQEGDKWRIQGTTYINNDPNKPWPVDFLVNSEAEANQWVEKHGWVVQ